jgi:hypothetical protein
VEEKIYQFFDHLWTDCTQEELRLRNRGVEDSLDDNHALALHTKKGGRFKRNFRQTFRNENSPSASGHNQRRDVSEIQCFRCDKYGHYARNCPTRKKGRQYASTADIDPDPLKRMKIREMRSISSKKKYKIEHDCRPR